jgi:type II secretory pathway pseudopilin PulG
VGIIAILAGIVIVAINPSKQLATVRNAERKSDVKQIDSAILQYYIDNFRYPAGITSDLKEVCNTGSVSSTTVAVDSTACGSLVNLSKLVPDYITAIPKDPRATSTGNGTGYYVKEDATTHKIGTKALLAELDQDININAASSTVAQGEEEVNTLGVDLVAHFKMNDASCDTVDNTQGNDGTGACTANQSGATANTATSMSFNGTSDEISFPDTGLPSGDSSRSFSFWVKLNSYGDWMSFIKYGTDNLGLGVAVSLNNAGHILLGTYGDGADNSSSNAIELDTWTHVVVVFNQSDYSVEYYINGSPDGTATVSTIHGNPNTTLTGTGYMGATSWGGAPVDGSLDDVRIYSRVLEQSEITALAAGTEAE